MTIGPARARAVNGTDWVELAGYRHETLHTGVLLYLLAEPGVGPEVASALIADSVTDVLDARTEVALPGSRRTADLRFTGRLASGSVDVAVETKVDSNALRVQLRESASGQQRGVLLAVGITGLMVLPEDLDPELTHWRVVAPREWSDILAAAGLHADPILAYYLRAVRREANEHEAARRLAQQPAQPLQHVIGARITNGQLEDFAWLAEVRAGVDDRASWETKKLVSGPLMALFPDEWNGAGQVYLEFMCVKGTRGRSRLLCLKVGWGQEAVQRLGPELAAVASAAGMQKRACRRNSTTCTCAFIDMTSFTPAQAAETTMTIRSAIDAAVAGLVAERDRPSPPLDP